LDSLRMCPMCPNYRMTNMIMEREGVKAREFVLLVPYLYQQVLKISIVNIQAHTMVVAAIIAATTIATMEEAIPIVRTIRLHLITIIVIMVEELVVIIAVVVVIILVAIMMNDTGGLVLLSLLLLGSERIMEISSMNPTDEQFLLDIAEEGRCTLDKYGTHFEIDAPTTIVATANPYVQTWNKGFNITKMRN
jgi:hypothetical protein